MKKLKKSRGETKKNESFVSNRIVLAAVAGALTGLALTYLLETEKGRSLLSQAGSAMKGLIGGLKLPTPLRA